MNAKVLRFEEYAPAADFLLVSFSRDRNELAGRFIEFTKEYEESFRSNLDKVRNLEQGLEMTQEQKNATINLYEKAEDVSGELDFVSFYLKRAQLDASPISKIKRAINRRNIEGACLKITALAQYLMAHRPELEAVGMVTSYPDKLLEDKTKLEHFNTLQNTLMDLRKQLHDDNKGVYKALSGYISTVAAAGKIMYKGQVKKDEYVISRLIGRMRAAKSE